MRRPGYSVALGAAVLLLVLPSAALAGEWIFRLKDAHVQLRKAMYDRDADAAWEQVNRETRQDAGLLAARIRIAYDGLTEAQKSSLRDKLGIADDQAIKSIQGKDILVAKIFLLAHGVIRCYPSYPTWASARFNLPAGRLFRDDRLAPPPDVSRICRLSARLRIRVIHRGWLESVDVDAVDGSPRRGSPLVHHRFTRKPPG